MDISSIRKMRNNDFSAISKAIESISTPSNNKKDSDDERMWKLTADKAGNGSAVIRFLSRTEGDELPWVKIIDHGFKGPNGRWYIEKSLATIGKPDPLMELNSELWNNGTEEGKKQAQVQKRRTAYYANVYIVSDPAKPENNGTVKIFKFGKKIMGMIMDKAKPTFADEQPVNVFDYFEGANFKLRMKKVEDYPNYDSSVFGSPEAVADSDDEIVAIVKQQFRLSEFLEESNFKTYDELKKKLQWVLNAEANKTPSAMDDTPSVPSRSAPEAKVVKSPETKAKASSFDDDDDDSFSIDRFKALAND